MPEDYAVSFFGQLRNVCGDLLSKALHTQGDFPGEVPQLPQKCLCAGSRLRRSVAAPTTVEGTDPENRLILIWTSLSEEAANALLHIKQFLTCRNKFQHFSELWWCFTCFCGCVRAKQTWAKPFNSAIYQMKNLTFSSFHLKSHHRQQHGW